MFWLEASVPPVAPILEAAPRYSTPEQVGLYLDGMREAIAKEILPHLSPKET
jgi:hypothetical protein